MWLLPRWASCIGPSCQAEKPVAPTRACVSAGLFSAAIARVFSSELMVRIMTLCLHLHRRICTDYAQHFVSCPLINLGPQ